jgi:hypothetical protein
MTQQFYSTLGFAEARYCQAVVLPVLVIVLSSLERSVEDSLVVYGMLVVVLKSFGRLAEDFLMMHGMCSGFVSSGSGEQCHALSYRNAWCGVT